MSREENNHIPKTELSNIDVVLYALLRLDGHRRKVHTEDVAYESYKLAKERFGWRLQKFREMNFPDKEPVRVALMDAAKEKYGSLVEGRSGVEASGKERDGWRFTPSGAAWIRENVERIEHALGIARPKTSQRETSQFLRQMRTQPLFKRFLEVGTLKGESRYAFTDMLIISPDAPRDIITLKFDRLRSMAELVGDRDIKRFLEACAEAFTELLTKSDVENKPEGNGE